MMTLREWGLATFILLLVTLLLYLGAKGIGKIRKVPIGRQLKDILSYTAYFGIGVSGIIVASDSYIMMVAPSLDLSFVNKFHIVFILLNIIFVFIYLISFNLISKKNRVLQCIKAYELKSLEQYPELIKYETCDSKEEFTYAVPKFTKDSYGTKVKDLLKDTLSEDTEVKVIREEDKMIVTIPK